MNNEICFEGKLLKPVLGNSWLVELPNGHQLTGFLQKKDRAIGSQLTAGGWVQLEATPFDLSKGRILSLLERNIIDDES